MIHGSISRKIVDFMQLHKLKLWCLALELEDIATAKQRNTVLVVESSEILHV